MFSLQTYNQALDQILHQKASYDSSHRVLDRDNFFCSHQTNAIKVPPRYPFAWFYWQYASHYFL